MPLTDYIVDINVVFISKAGERVIGHQMVTTTARSKRLALINVRDQVRLHIGNATPKKGGGMTVNKK